jgi:ribose transport system substrate-binding protein
LTDFQEEKMKKSNLFVLCVVLAVMLFTAQNLFGGGRRDAPATTGQTQYKMAWYAPLPHPTFDLNLTGVKRFVDETGIDVRTQLGTGWNQQEENENVQAMAAMGYTPIAICPADQSSVNALYEELKEYGVPVIEFCINTTDPNPASEIFLGTDLADSATMAMEELCKQLNYSGSVLHIIEDIMEANMIRKRAIEAVAAKYPNITMLPDIAGMSTVEEATKKITDGLSANIDKVDGIITQGFTPTIAVSNVLRDYYDRGYSRRLKAVGIDWDDVIVKAVQDDILTGSIIQNPQGQSYLACHIMKLMVEGWKKAPGVYYINSGTAMLTKVNSQNQQFLRDVDAVTDGIKAQLTTKYLQKR